MFIFWCLYHNTYIQSYICVLHTTHWHQLVAQQHVEHQHRYNHFWYISKLTLYEFLYTVAYVICRLEVFQYIDWHSTIHTAPKQMAATQTAIYPTMLMLISNTIPYKMHCYTIVLSSNHKYNSPHIRTHTHNNTYTSTATCKAWVIKYPPVARDNSYLYHLGCKDILKSQYST